MEQICGWEGDERMEIDAVGLDLDGTLLALSPKFLPRYLDRLDTVLAPQLNVRGRIAPHVLASTAVMCAGGGRARVLADIFFEDFADRTGIGRDRLEPRLDAFIRAEFPRWTDLGRPVAGLEGLLASIKAAGVKIALLANPVLPRAAVEERMRWAGIDDFPFDFVSAFDCMRTSKPDPDFFGEAAEALGVAPARCLMVGADLRADVMSAWRAGWQGWWDCGSRDPGRGALPDRVRVGSLGDLAAYLRRLQGCG